MNQNQVNPISRAELTQIAVSATLGRSISRGVVWARRRARLIIDEPSGPREIELPEGGTIFCEDRPGAGVEPGVYEFIIHD